MYGNVNWQVQQIYNKSGINCIGSSKHAAKEEIRKKLNNINKAVTWHEIGKKTGIFSYSTADAYRDVWKQVGKHLKAEFKIKDMEKLEGQHIQSFLEKKIEEDVSLNTFAQYASACEKLESSLRGFAEKTQTGREYFFSDSIKITRDDAHVMLERFDGSRAYDSPGELISNISDKTHQIIARMQYESGARISECTYLNETNLRGITHDLVTGKEKGCIYVEKAKGGINGEKFMSKETYLAFEKKINEAPGGIFKFKMKEYREGLKNAAGKSKQQYTGSHGLRWNFARDRFQEVQRDGNQTYDQALCQVSNEMFHQRADITRHYLK
jgi:integrase